jgi:hypothetical protein
VEKLLIKLSAVASILLLTTACQHLSQLSLTPPSAATVYSLVVTDPSEIDLLRQQLHLDIVTVRDSLVYFHSPSAETMTRLASLGYAAPRTAIPDDVYMLYGEIKGNYDEATILQKGVRIINREKDYVIVYGSIAKLKGLGYNLYVPAEEIRPREIEVSVPAQPDIQKIYDLGVDIFSVGKDSTGKRGFIVHATAFDHQIDSIRKMNFPVTIIRPKI